MRRKGDRKGGNMIAGIFAVREGKAMLSSEHHCAEVVVIPEKSTCVSGEATKRQG